LPPIDGGDSSESTTGDDEPQHEHHFYKIEHAVLFDTNVESLARSTTDNKSGQSVSLAEMAARREKRIALSAEVLDRLEDPAQTRRQSQLFWASITVAFVAALVLSWLIYAKMVSPLDG
jgi:hypothetical protein